MHKKNEEQNIKAVQVFEQLCDKSESVNAFVAVALDPDGLVSIGSMGLDRLDIVNVLEQTVGYLRSQYVLDNHANLEESEDEIDDFTHNQTLH